MFDVGFSELVVIAIVALVVIGPERLPRVARTVGFLLGRMQRYVSDVKADISREMQIEELKRLKAELQESADHFERSINNEFQELGAAASRSPDSSETAHNATNPEDVPAGKAPPIMTESSSRSVDPLDRA